LEAVTGVQTCALPI
jgi:hypothetical protein